MGNGYGKRLCIVCGVALNGKCGTSSIALHNSSLVCGHAEGRTIIVCDGDRDGDTGLLVAKGITVTVTDIDGCRYIYDAIAIHDGIIFDTEGEGNSRCTSGHRHLTR